MLGKFIHPDSAVSDSCTDTTNVLLYPPFDAPVRVGVILETCIDTFKVHKSFVYVDNKGRQFSIEQDDFVVLFNLIKSIYNT